MSARGFGSVIWAGAVASAALGFYLVSLRVALFDAFPRLKRIDARMADGKRQRAGRLERGSSTFKW